MHVASSQLLLTAHSDHRYPLPALTSLCIVIRIPAKTKKGIAADELSESFSSKLGMFKSKEKKVATSPDPPPPPPPAALTHRHTLLEVKALLKLELLKTSAPPWHLCCAAGSACQQ